MPRLSPPARTEVFPTLREEVTVDADTGEIVATSTALVAAAPSALEAAPQVPGTLEQALFAWGQYQIPLTLEERRLYLIAQSGVYKAVRTLGQALALSEMARTLGISEHAAFSGIHPGLNSMSAHLIGALVRKSGVYDYRVVEMTMERCEIAWYRHGEEIGRSAFTVEDARRQGRVKALSAWVTSPNEMCRNRALAIGCRTYCGEVFAGAGVYVTEELTDDSSS